MSLELNPEVERLLLERAGAAGTSASDYVARLLQVAPPADLPDSIVRVVAMLNEWQQRDHTPIAAPVPNDSGLTPSEALFRLWDREDANMTEAELGW
jgi:hypothetical protein